MKNIFCGIKFKIMAIFREVVKLIQKYVSILILSLGVFIAAPSQAKREDARISVEGVTGQSVLLPCNIAVPPQDRVALVLWYRNNLPDAIFTYDARETAKDHRQTGLLESRAYFALDQQTLKLRRASVEDSGDYECRVDFVKEPSVTTLLNVRIVDPPNNLVIRRNGKLVSYTVEANVGSNLDLDCFVTGGTPSPNVWWTLNGRMIDYTYEAADENEIRNSVRMVSLTRELHQSKLACHASNNNITKVTHQDITLFLNFPPTRVQISGLATELHDGRTYRALCEVEGSRPPSIVTWKLTPLRGKKKIIDRTDFSRRNQSRMWLEFAVDSSLNEATLSCEAISPALPNTVVLNETTLNVVFAPRLNLSLGDPLKAEHIKEGVDVYFKCSISANPSVSVVKWYRNNVEVVHNKSNGVIISHRHLVLQKILKKWTGDFSCKAFNSIGAASSDPLRITVQYAPVCIQAENVIRVAIGHEAKVPCRVRANPANVTFSWIFTNTVNQQNISQKRISRTGMNSTLSYTPEKSEDYGMLECWAENSIDKQKYPCRITIKPAGAPTAPNCSVSNQTWDSLKVICVEIQETVSSEAIARRPSQQISGRWDLSERFDYSVPKETSMKVPELGSDSVWSKYLLTVRESISNTLVYNTTGHGRVFHVTGLTPGLDYVISISRYNNHGKSSDIILEALTHRTAENRMREEKVENDQAVLGGIVGAIGIVIVIAVTSLLIALKGRSRTLRLEDTTLRSNSHDDDIFDDSQNKSSTVCSQSRVPIEDSRLLTTHSVSEESNQESQSQQNLRVDIPQPDLLENQLCEEEKERMCLLRSSSSSTTKTSLSEVKEFDFQHILRSKRLPPYLPASHDASSPTASCSSSQSALSPFHGRTTQIHRPLTSPPPLQQESFGKHTYVRMDTSKYPERESFL